jgi:hypothetical protein
MNLGLACQCGGFTEVNDSRPRMDGGIRRRRRCVKCGERFTTMEVRVTDVGDLTPESGAYEPSVLRQLHSLFYAYPHLSPEDRSTILRLALRFAGETGEAPADQVAA